MEKEFNQLEPDRRRASDLVLVRLDERTKHLDERTKKIETKLDDKYVTKNELRYVKLFVDGCITVLLTTILGSLITIIWKAVMR